MRTTFELCVCAHSKGNFVGIWKLSLEVLLTPPTSIDLRRRQGSQVATSGRLSERLERGHTKESAIERCRRSSRWSPFYGSQQADRITLLSDLGGTCFGICIGDSNDKCNMHELEREVARESLLECWATLSLHQFCPGKSVSEIAQLKRQQQGNRPARATTC